MRRVLVTLGWTLVIWFVALFLMGFLAGLVGSPLLGPGAESTAHMMGRKYGALLLLGSFALAVLGSAYGLLPGAGTRRISRKRTCPFCAESVKAEAIVCRHCGRDLPPQPPAAA
jgi:hypothetical protein